MKVTRIRVLPTSITSIDVRGRSRAATLRKTMHPIKYDNDQSAPRDAMSAGLAPYRSLTAKMMPKDSVPTPRLLMNAAGAMTAILLFMIDIPLDMSLAFGHDGRSIR